MYAALLHPGDLGLLNLLALLLVVVGVPAVVLFALAWAVYGGLAVRRETYTVIHLGESLEPND